MKKYVKITVFILAIFIFALSLCACAPIRNLIDGITGAPQTDVEKVNEAIGLLTALVENPYSLSGGEIEDIEDKSITDIIGEFDFSLDNVSVYGGTNEGSIIVKDGIISIYGDGEYAYQTIKIYDSAIFVTTEKNGDVLCNGITLDDLIGDSFGGLDVGFGIEATDIAELLKLDNDDLKSTDVEGVYNFSRDYVKDVIGKIFPNGDTDDVMKLLKDSSFVIDVRDYDEYGKIKFAFEREDESFTLYTAVSRKLNNTVLTITPEMEGIESASIKATFKNDVPETLDFDIIYDGDEVDLKVKGKVEYSDGTISLVDADADVTDEAGETCDICFNYVLDKQTEGKITTVSEALEFSMDAGESDGVVLKLSDEIAIDDGSIVKLFADVDFETKESAVKGKINLDQNAEKIALFDLAYRDEQTPETKISAEVVKKEASESSVSYSLSAKLESGKDSKEISADLNLPAKSEHNFSEKVKMYLHNADIIYDDYAKTLNKAREIEEAIYENFIDVNYSGLPNPCAYYDKNRDVYYLVQLVREGGVIVPKAQALADGKRYAFAYSSLYSDCSNSYPPKSYEYRSKIQMELDDELDEYYIPRGSLNGMYHICDYIPEYDVYYMILWNESVNGFTSATQPTEEEFGYPIHNVKRENGKTWIHNVQMKSDDNCMTVFYCDECGVSYTSNAAYHLMHAELSVVASQQKNGKTAWELSECARCDRLELKIYDAGEKTVNVDLERLKESHLGEYRGYTYTGDYRYALVIKRITCMFMEADVVYNLEIPDLSKWCDYRIVGVDTYNVYGQSHSVSLYKAHLKLPDGLIFINARAFADNQYSSIILPESLEYIGQGAFLYSQFVSELVIRGNIRVIKDGAFDFGSIERVVVESAILGNYVIDPEK